MRFATLLLSFALASIHVVVATDGHQIELPPISTTSPGEYPVSPDKVASTDDDCTLLPQIDLWKALLPG
jgi:hypothetical protein